MSVKVRVFNPIKADVMIERSKVSKVIIRRICNGRRFVVYGVGVCSTPCRQRGYRDYARALKYSLELSDYYQAQVEEIG
jgi:hypothetical protein